MTTLERSARDLGFQLVETPGDVVLVTSGPGLVMMMMDLLADHGLFAASPHESRDSCRWHPRTARHLRGGWDLFRTLAMGRTGSCTCI